MLSAQNTHFTVHCSLDLRSQIEMSANCKGAHKPGEWQSCVALDSCTPCCCWQKKDGVGPTVSVPSKVGRRIGPLSAIGHWSDSKGIVRTGHYSPNTATGTLSHQCPLVPATVPCLAGPFFLLAIIVFSIKSVARSMEVLSK